MHWSAKRYIVGLYLLSIVLLCTYVPWKIEGLAGTQSLGYSFIWVPPESGYEVGAVDLPRVILELITITAILIGTFLVTGVFKKYLESIPFLVEIDQRLLMPFDSYPGSSTYNIRPIGPVSHDLHATHPGSSGFLNGGAAHPIPQNRCPQLRQGPIAFDPPQSRLNGQQRTGHPAVFLLAIAPSGDVAGQAPQLRIDRFQDVGRRKALG